MTLRKNASMVDRVVVASPGGREGPSARGRLGPLALAARWPVEFYSAGSFPTQEQLAPILAAGSTSAALVLQRVMPPDDDLRRLRKNYAAIVFDLDDAIYAVPPDLRGSQLIAAGKGLARLVMRGSPTASARKKPLTQTLQGIDVAVVGNEILGKFVGRHAKRVIEIPTTVEPVAAPSAERPHPPVVVWMGLPDNMQFLEIARGPLEKLRGELEFAMRLVSSSEWNEASFPVEFVPWSEEASRAALLSSTVGIAPLTDDPWTRGKCANRAIQYGGHALPTIASPVGITDRVVMNGTTGYLVRNAEEWLGALRMLLTRPDQASAMGRAALAHVRASYSDDIAVARWSEVISSL